MAAKIHDSPAATDGPLEKAGGHTAGLAALRIGVGRGHAIAVEKMQ